MQKRNAAARDGRIRSAADAGMRGAPALRLNTSGIRGTHLAAAQAAP